LSWHRDQSISVRFRFRNRFLVSISAALAVLITPALLLAHARLLRSSPSALARLVTPPSELRLWFSERPELRFSFLSLVDSAGTTIPLGAIVTGDSMSLMASIEKPLSAGRYAVAWRTAAADGHSTSGRFVFTVAIAAEPALPVPGAVAIHRDTIISKTVSPEWLASAGDDLFARVLRWVELSAAMLIIGAIVFRLFVLPGAQWPVSELAFAYDRARRAAIAAVVLFIAADVGRLFLMSSLLASVAPPPTTAFRLRGMAMLSVVRDTRWGHGWLFAAVGAVVALIALFLGRAGARPWIAAGVGTVAIAVGEAMTGHSGAMGARAPLGVAIDVAHILGAAGWLGGLACVVLCGLPVLRRIDEQRRALAGSQLVRSYHRAAIECVVLTIGTALVAAWLRLPHLESLWTTPYGLALLRKIVVVVFVLGIGLFHWRTAVLKDWVASTAKQFRLSAALELALGLVVIGLTVVLISTELPS
jgi:putative copper export protein/methionine-rich copper-binding protein CopC